ncbi:hypothetical protein FO519_000388 [Halicephalobus sp. NKZ332]|nr:hypothetical protein FO519_000388 [Halicephalobus sp. NKZ332]
MLYAEDDYDLYLAPRVAEYSPLKGGTSRHLMVNGTPDRMAIKVKCSNNEIFRVSPVYTCLEPGCSQRLQVIRDPGDPKVDKLIVLYKKTDCKSAHDAFYQADNTEVKKALIALVALKHKGIGIPKENSQNSTGSKENKNIESNGQIPNGNTVEVKKPILKKPKDTRKKK